MFENRKRNTEWSWLVLFTCLCLSVLFCPAQEPAIRIEPAGAELWPSIEENRAVLINGRILHPAGKLRRTQSYNWGMALHPDGKTLAMVNRDAAEFYSLQGNVDSRRFPPYGVQRPEAYGKGSYMGCVFSPDGTVFYLGDADNGRILKMDSRTGEVKGYFHLNGGDFQDSFAGDFVPSKDGKRLYVLDQFNYRLVILDTSSGEVKHSIGIGRNPFAIRISPDGRFAWICHVGIFTYPLLPGIRPDDRRTAGISFPAYGIPSIEAENGTVAEGKNIPGLGSPNHPDAMSVFQVDLLENKVIRKIKTGYRIGVERDGKRTVGGAHPASVAVGRNSIYVANAGNDTVSVVDISSGEVKREILLTLPRLETLRGILPFGIDLDAEEKRLYVACAGANAVAVLNLTDHAVEGWIPCGWFCNLVRCSPDGRSLYIYSAKGMGSGPNGGKDFQAPVRGTHPGDIMQGLLQVVDVPGIQQLKDMTATFFQGLYRLRPSTEKGTATPGAIASISSLPAGAIEHVVFIVKENRTFDQVFGQRTNVRGDASLAELGMKVAIHNKAKTKTVRDADISPNHQALADQFSISDNFYCDSDQSNTGHRWVAGVYPNEWVEVNARSRIQERIFSSAPGRRYVNGAAAVVNPEDYNEAGAMWEHLDRNGVRFYNFGMGMEMPASLEEKFDKYTGIRMSVSFPLPKALFDRTSRRYATFNMAIPDQFRVDMFEEEFAERWEKGKEPFPQLIAMVLPNDHLTEEHPKDGYPFRESYMADNDLALGRIIHKLSRTPYWKKMLVIVTEDDSQSGKDHVEAHRSLLMLIGPWVKRGYVSHQLADFSSIMKLIFSLYDLPPLNQFDAVATLPVDAFQSQPDFTPYQLRRADKRIFDPKEVLKPFDRGFNWDHYRNSPIMDDPEDMRREHQKPNKK